MGIVSETAASMESTVRLCPKCGIVKPLYEFTIHQSGERNGQAVAFCKTCNTEAAKAYQKERVAREPDAYRKYEWPSKLKSYYGITVLEYHRLLAEQGGGCAICESKTPQVGSRKYKKNVRLAFDVDHDHKTGKVRGLLCTRCNRLVGLANDDPTTAKRLVEYLSK
jgi:Autographiviridae endonuclease VII